MDGTRFSRKLGGRNANNRLTIINLKKMTDFSKTLIHCSSTYCIMVEPEGKSPMQQYLDMIECIKTKEEEYKTRYTDTNKEYLALASKAKDKISEYKAKLIEMEARKHEELLSPGCKSHLNSVYAYEKYGKWSADKDKGNKYTNKGDLAENDSITLLSILDGKLYEKNRIRVENDFLTGVPDIIEGESIYNAEKIIDVKTSWDIETFFFNLGKPLIPKYWWQVQGYMALTGASIAEVSFCLVNTPESLLNEEKYRLLKRLDVATEENPEYILAAAELVNNLTFDDIPAGERVIRFFVERDDDSIQRIYKRVQSCRKYLQEIEKMHVNLSYDTVTYSNIQ
jgi:hypothetical protein